MRCALRMRPRFSAREFARQRLSMPGGPGVNQRGAGLHAYPVTHLILRADGQVKTILARRLDQRSGARGQLRGRRNRRLLHPPEMGGDQSGGGQQARQSEQPSFPGLQVPGH